MKKTTLIVLVINIILYILIGSFITTYPTMSVLLGSIAYIAVTYFYSKKGHNVLKSMLISLISINFFFIAIAIILNGVNKFNIAPNVYIFLYVLSIIFGRILAKKTLKNIILIFIIYIPIIYINAKYLPVFVQQYNFFKTFTGKNDYDFLVNQHFLDAKNDSTFTFSDIDKEVLVLDFWNNGCGVCFQKFPYLKSLQDKYSNKPNVGFYAVNAYNKNSEIETGQDLFDTHTEDLDTFFISYDTCKELKIDKFPTVLVVKGNKVIFRGTIETLSALDFIYLK